MKAQMTKKEKFYCKLGRAVEEGEENESTNDKKRKILL